MARAEPVRSRAHHGCRLEMYKDFQEVPATLPTKIFSWAKNLVWHGAIYIVSSWAVRSNPSGTKGKRDDSRDSSPTRPKQFNSGRRLPSECSGSCHLSWRQSPNCVSLG